MNDPRRYVQCLLAIALSLFAIAIGNATSAGAATEVERKTANGVGAFAVDMYLELAKEGGNIVFSPQNISSALAMAYAGASRPAGEEMAKVLHFAPDIHESMGSLEKRIAAQNTADCLVRTANAVWPAKDVALATEFEKVIKKYYASEIRQLDYAKNPEKARAIINRWVEGKTNDLIKNLIPSGGVNRDTPMVLTSAIYFLGKWQKPFDKMATRDAPFYGEKKTNAKMMYKREEVAYLERGGAEMIRVPYWGGATP